MFILYLCSFDICSLFTSVRLLETIDICTDLLYHIHLSLAEIPENIFIKLIKFATMSVEFSFDNVMYRPIDGVSMRSPLGPALANFFVWFHEKRLLSYPNKPVVYFRNVNNTFYLFNKIR